VAKPLGPANVFIGSRRYLTGSPTVIEKHHFSKADEELLTTLARERGITPANFVEQLVSAALVDFRRTYRAPVPRPLGHSSLEAFQAV
jgi:hypothetical protein